MINYFYFYIKKSGNCHPGSGVMLNGNQGHRISHYCETNQALELDPDILSNIIRKTNVALKWFMFTGNHLHWNLTKKIKEYSCVSNVSVQQNEAWTLWLHNLVKLLVHKGSFSLYDTYKLDVENPWKYEVRNSDGSLMIYILYQHENCLL